ncbi:hypothetical protein ACN27F_15735 [Solwaraspora sp. WMMB335]|uniref:hypothetical protein n=1 Tax=Solwaraspora sp. WMMB335 TaxID=3404118 RepID=UPI003B95FBA1
MDRQRQDQPTRLNRCLITGVTLAFVAALIMAAFTWPAVYAQPRGVPVGLVGPPAEGAAAAALLTQARPHEFTIRPYETREVAIAAIRHRQVYGAVVPGDPPELLVASGASTVASQLITALAPAVAGGPPGEDGGPVVSGRVEVTDVVPLSRHDERGAGLSAFFFPLLLGGLKGGIFIALGIQGTARRLLTLAVLAATAGVAVAGVGQVAFRILGGSFVLNAMASGLAIAAIAATIIGLRNLVGLHGVGVGTVLIMLVGSPISAAALPVEFLPRPWGEIGQLFPPGASVALIRNISYFPQAQLLPQWLVLGGWTLAGTALAVLFARRPPAWTRSRTPPDTKIA